MGEPFPFRRGDDHGRDGDRHRIERGRGEMRAGFDRDGDFPRGREAFRREFDEDRGMSPLCCVFHSNLPPFLIHVFPLSNFPLCSFHLDSIRG